jgi:hypothetical protein
MEKRATRTVLLVLSAIALGMALGAVSKFGLGYELSAAEVAAPKLHSTTL